MRRGGLVFSEIDPHRWRLAGRNPVQVPLRAHARAPARGRRPARDRASGWNWLARELVADPARRQAPGAEFDGSVAYFSAEFGVHSSLPGYSGGLGVLAGDVLKEASDRGLRMVGVGLFYRRGYFSQRLDLTGTQQEYWLEHDPAELPMALVNGADGEPLRLSVTLFGRADRSSRSGACRSGACRCSCSTPSCPRTTRSAGGRPRALYDGNTHIRLAQYGLLGIGGARVLEALDIQPDVVHLNEGHPALAALERVALPRRAGDAARRGARAGAQARRLHDAHAAPGRQRELSARAVPRGVRASSPAASGSTARRSSTSAASTPGEGEPGMSQLAMRLSSRRNGVSRRHGELAREMWKPMFPSSDVPIDHVTNGAHLATFLGDPMYVAARTSTSASAGCAAPPTRPPGSPCGTSRTTSSGTLAPRRAGGSPSSPSRRPSRTGCCAARRSSTSARAPTCSTRRR